MVRLPSGTSVRARFELGLSMKGGAFSPGPGSLKLANWASTSLAVEADDGLDGLGEAGCWGNAVVDGEPREVSGSAVEADGDTSATEASSSAAAGVEVYVETISSSWTSRSGQSDVAGLDRPVFEGGAVLLPASADGMTGRTMGSARSATTRSVESGRRGRGGGLSAPALIDPRQLPRVGIASACDLNLSAMRTDPDAGRDGVDADGPLSDHRKEASGVAGRGGLIFIAFVGLTADSIGVS